MCTIWNNFHGNNTLNKTLEQKVTLENEIIFPLNFHRTVSEAFSEEIPPNFHQPVSEVFSQVIPPTSLDTLLHKLLGKPNIST